jgi:hypothetical protein
MDISAAATGESLGVYEAVSGRAPPVRLGRALDDRSALTLAGAAFYLVTTARVLAPAPRAISISLTTSPYAAASSALKKTTFL